MSEPKDVDLTVLHAEGKSGRQQRLLPLSSIKMDRWAIQPATLKLVRHLESGGTVPPVHVQLTPSGQYRILDGRHRVTAFKLLGRKAIEVRYGMPEAERLKWQRRLRKAAKRLAAR